MGCCDSNGVEIGTGVEKGGSVGEPSVAKVLPEALHADRLAKQTKATNSKTYSFVIRSFPVEDQF